MNEPRKQRPFYWWRLWPLVAFAALIVWELVEANVEGRAPDYVWLGIAVAGSVVVVILRVFMRV